MKCLPFLLLISVILEPARPAGNLNAAPESLQQAQDRLLNQEVEQRRQAALRALKINPADASANYQLGMIALAQKKPAEALPYFERIHVQRATDIPPLTGILECQLLLKRRLAARQTVQELKRLLKLQDPRLFEVASLLAQYGDYAAAIPIMEQIRIAFPGSYDVSYNLALAYFRSKQYGNAAHVLELLLNQQPRAEAYNLLAMVEEEQQQYLEAVRSFQRAAELEPGDEGFRFDYAYELLKHQTNPAAIAIFASGVRDFPRSGRMRLGLGSAYYLAARHEEAAKALLDAVKVEPGAAFAYFLLGKLYESVEEPQAAIQAAFESYLAKKPKDPWAYYHYALILQQRLLAEPHPDFRTVQAYLNRALALNPSFAEAILQLGIVKQQEGRHAESIPILQKVLQLNPRLEMAHFRLGQAYKRLGQTDKAMAEYELFEKLKSAKPAEKEKQGIVQFLVEPKK